MNTVYFDNKARDVIQEILGRYSVTDLIEQTDEDLQKADEQFYKSDKPMQIIEKGRVGMIDWWKIQSGSEIYECRRFKSFCWCECLSFFFRKKMCRHLAATTSPPCAECHELRATVGKYCFDCSQKIHRYSRKPAADAVAV